MHRNTHGFERAWHVDTVQSNELRLQPPLQLHAVVAAAASDDAGDAPCPLGWHWLTTALDSDKALYHCQR